MAENISYIQSDTLVTHIPTASARIRLRGYDQSKLLAKEIAKLLGLKYSTILVRIGQERQVGAKREVRNKQLANSFRVQNENLIKEKSILLIDDVITTGATLESAAKTLKKSGAKEVRVVVFAQAK